jgi:hypothetical protein
MSEELRACWKGSRLFRAALVTAAAWALLRLAVHGLYLATLLNPTLLGAAGMGEWGDTPQIPVDLALYRDAAQRLLARADLYPTAARIEVYQYSPFFALLFVPFLLLPLGWLVTVHSLLHLGAYALLYLCWGRILRGSPAARRVLARMLPLWLVFSAFWADLGYLNIYIPVALLGSLLIEAVLAQRIGAALLWLTLIMPAKPHWAFPVLLPLLLGQWRFFARLASGGLAIYAALVCATLAIVGTRYGVQQYAGYLRLLASLRDQFPWRGPEAPFLGYNHSITQVVVYLLGVSPATLRLATIVKGLLLAPLAAMGLSLVLRRVRGLGRLPSWFGLELALALYLGTFIWLDMVWEVSLGAAVFAYLAGIEPRPLARIAHGILFVPYALVDVWQVLSLAIFGTRVLAPGPYVLTDPSIHVPLTLGVIVAFYGSILPRLWQAVWGRPLPRRHSEVGPC